MSTEPLFTNANSAPDSSAKRTRKRASKVPTSSTDPIILPQPLAIIVDHYAYMSKHTGQLLTYEEAVQQAVILHAEALAKAGELTPHMVAQLTKFKAAHPAFRANPAA